MPRNILMPLALTAMLAVATASAQATPGADLARYAPASSLLSFSMDADDGVPQGLRDALAALPWEDAGQLLFKLIGLLDDGAELDEFLPRFTTPQGVLQQALEEVCVPAADALAGHEIDELVDGLLVSLSISPFAPMPQLLVLAHSPRPEAMARLQAGLTACWGGDLLEQDGVQLTVLGDGGDMPVVVAQLDDVSILATDPNLVRAAVRLARGSSEGSLADSALGQAIAGLTPGGLKLGIDFAGIAEVVTGLTGPLGAEERAIAERALRTLRTFGTAAFSLGWADGGLLWEQSLRPDRSADPQLASLFLDAPAVSPPPWMPVDAVAVGSYTFPLHGLIGYIDGWLADLEGLIGWRTDLRSLSADMLGLDLDAALLDWLGGSYHVVVLDALGTDVRPWLQGPGMVAMFPVSDETAARQGLELLGSAAQELRQRFGDLVDDPYGFGPSSEDRIAAALFGLDNVAVTQSTVRGVQVDRLRIGWAYDLAVAVVDGHLLVASPARALEPVLAVRAGALAELGALPSWGGELARLQPGAVGFSLSDAATQFDALADLGEAFVQPMAALASAAIEEMLYRPSATDPYGTYDPFGDGFDELWPYTGDWMTEESWNAAGLAHLDLDSMVAGSLAWNDSVDATLGESGYLVYRTPPGEGQVIEVEVLDLGDGWNSRVDTYLYVADEEGTVLFHNDDGPNTSRSYVAFVAEPGRSYQLVVSSFSGSDQGMVQLNVGERLPEEAVAEEPAEEDQAIEVEPLEEEPEEAVELPSFAELLQAFEIGPRALRILADHSGLVVGQSWVEDGVLRTRVLWPLR